MHSKPQRRYTVSAKVFAANRLNLAKANAVPKEVRFRSTPARLDSCFKNLFKAQEANRAEGSRRHAPCFRLGIQAASLERSAFMASESRAELDRHLERFEAAYAPASDVERRLVRGMARAAWRRLRAFRGQANWEFRAVEARLRQALDWRPQTPGPFRQELFDFHLLLAEECAGISLTDAALYDPLRKLDYRVKRLGELLELVRARRGAPLDLDSLRPSERWLLAQSEHVLGHPLRGSRWTEATLAARLPHLKPWAEWAGWEFRPPGGQHENYFWEERMFPEHSPALRYGLIHPVSPDGGAGRLARDDHEGFVQLFITAFMLGDSRIENRNEKEFIIHNSKFENAGPVSARQSAIPTPEIRAAAEALWARLEASRALAERQAEGIRRFLDQAIAGRGAQQVCHSEEPPAAKSGFWTPMGSTGPQKSGNPEPLACHPERPGPVPIRSGRRGRGSEGSRAQDDSDRQDDRRGEPAAAGSSASLPAQTLTENLLETFAASGTDWEIPARHCDFEWAQYNLLVKIHGPHPRLEALKPDPAYQATVKFHHDPQAVDRLFAALKNSKGRYEQVGAAWRAALDGPPRAAPPDDHDPGGGRPR